MPRVVPSLVVKVIDRVVPLAKGQKDTQGGRFAIDGAHQNELAAIIALVDQISPELLTLEHDDYADLQVSVTVIRNTIEMWKAGKLYRLERILEYGNLNPVTIIRNLLSKCPDEGILESTSDIPFISDQDFRDSLRIDISSANQAFQNGEWKAATVLAGATIEAVLLYVLHLINDTDPSKISTSKSNLVKKRMLHKRPDNNLDRWMLQQLTEVTLDLGLIKEETAAQTRVARDFRNLIHPGVSVRKNIVCNRGTALSALAGLEHVINDLSANPP